MGVATLQVDKYSHPCTCRADTQRYEYRGQVDGKSPRTVDNGTNKMRRSLGARLEDVFANEFLSNATTIENRVLHFPFISDEISL